MSKGKALTDFEKGQIIAYYETIENFREIGRKIGRSGNVVGKFLNNIENYGKAVRTGRPRILSERQVRKTKKVASNSRLSVRNINTQLDTGVSDSSVLRAIKEDKDIVFVKMKHSPNPTVKHKKARFDYALEHVLWKKEWKSVIFSDEKKFNLDGPDGFKYYWHHLNLNEISYSKGVQGGSGIMVWVAFCYNHKLTIWIVSKRMDSAGYCEMLSGSLISFLEDNKENNYIFQQDNVPCHRAKKTMTWFEENEVTYMDWPALSPDLNPVENIWSDMSKIVYANGKQYSTLQELQTAILVAWAIIPQDEMRSYVLGMQKRMLDVMKNLGGKIDK